MSLSDPTARLAAFAFSVLLLAGSLLWFGGAMLA